jgi:NAD(P)-dependent dehydrogenase (short-subunit alcohol dehydrogenase family)
MLLKGKVALVTGTATGIGAEVARLFGEQGASLILLDRDRDRNQAAAAALAAAGVPVRAAALDLRDGAAVRAAVADALDALGQIDILVNNAGVYPRRAFLETSEAEWDDMQAINLKSMFHLAQAVLPGMVARRAGKLVNISSVTFHLGMANLVHYVASKGGVIGFTRSLAREMGGHNIHVNCVTPGAVLVEAEKAVVTEEQIQAWLGEQCLKRRILPLDIARACLFLACELSDGMTGQTLNVDGGWVMH